MPLRNPFRRQTEVPASLLRERAAELRASLARPQQRPAPATSEPDAKAAEDWHASPVDLIAAAGLSVETLPVSDLCSMLDAAEILSNVAAAITCQPRQMTKGNFNGAGRLIESTAFALHRAIDVVARELRRRAPDDKYDQTCRLTALASLTIQNDDAAETAAFARELLAMVEP